MQPRYLNHFTSLSTTPSTRISNDGADVPWWPIIIYSVFDRLGK
jgi:hypothetical protein